MDEGKPSPIRSTKRTPEMEAKRAKMQVLREMRIEAEAIVKDRGWPVDRILAVAQSLLDSDGHDAAAASTGERVAAAMLIDRPDWSGYPSAIEAADRLGAEWVMIVAQMRQQGLMPESLAA